MAPINVKVVWPLDIYQSTKVPQIEGIVSIWPQNGVGLGLDRFKTIIGLARYREIDGVTHLCSKL